MAWLAGSFLIFILLTGESVSAKTYQIAMITWRGETTAEKGFIDELAAGGYETSITKYHADQDYGKLLSIIEQIKQSNSNLIYVFGTTATKAVLKRIKEKPVVFNIVNRPVRSGIIASWEHSGNNATGASNQVSETNQLMTLKKVVDFKRLGIIYNPKEQNSVIQKNNIKALEKQFGFILSEFKITNRQDVAKVLPGLDGTVDAIFLPADSMIKFLGTQIMAHVNRFKIPSLSSVGGMVPEDGVLMGFEPKYYDLGRIAARKAIRIITGEKPTDIPSSVLDHYHVSVNMKTAHRIQVQIPMAVLVLANQIVR